MDLHKETVPFGRHGHTASSSTRAKLVADDSYKPLKGVLLRAPAGNTAAVYIGDYRVTADTDPGTGGLALEAGQTLLLPIDNPSALYVVSALAQDVGWIIL